MAVLEALRGRTDAARRLMGAARRIVERLGLAHRRLEIDVAAGFVELLDGRAVEAEALLRAAYDELRERGLDGEAAQAAAMLGRALLLQDRPDDADAVAVEAEALAGADLKASIAWRGVRAEAAARRGDIDAALVLANEAVDMAAATDALLLVADARLTLATVLHAAGETAAAEAETERAIEACEAKEATAMLARARPMRAAGERAGRAPAPPVEERSPAPVPNAASRAFAAMHDAARRGLAGLHGTARPGVRQRRPPPRRRHDDDRRRGPRRLPDDGSSSTTTSTGGRCWPPGASASRSCARSSAFESGEVGPAEVETLNLVAIDEVGRVAREVVWDAADVAAAYAELDRAGAEHAPVENAAWRAFAALHDADWPDGAALLAPGYVYDYRRGGVSTVMTGEEAMSSKREIVILENPSTLLATRGDRFAVVHYVVRFESGEVGPAEFESVALVEIDELGRIAREVAWDTADVAEAYAELDRVSADDAAPRANAAWRTSEAIYAAVDARDWTAVLSLIAPDFVNDTRRSGVAMVTTGEQALSAFRSIFLLDDYADRRTLLATRGEHLALIRTLDRFESGEVGPAEVETLTMIEVDELGRATRQVSWDPEDVAAAYEELDRAAPRPNAAWRTSEAIEDAADARDWTGLLSLLAPDFVWDDRRSGIAMVTTGEAALSAYRTIFLLDDYVTPAHVAGHQGRAPRARAHARPLRVG